MNPIARLAILSLILLQQSCRAGYEPPPISEVGSNISVQVGRIEWAVKDTIPESLQLYRTAPRPLDLGFIEALAQKHNIPKSKTIPEDIGPLGEGVASYEDYDQNAPKALYYQPMTGTFILSVDSSGGFSTFAERVNDNWPGLPTADEAYDLALALFPEMGLDPADFFKDGKGRLEFTVSNNFLGWLDAKTDKRRREPTTITLKFYRQIGEHRIASSGQGGCALFEFGPHKKLMSVEWRLHKAEPSGTEDLKSSEMIIADIQAGKAFGRGGSLAGETLTITDIAIRPFEGSAKGQAIFYPFYELTGTLTPSEDGKAVSLWLPALR
jgi:hypothetical protein